MWKRTLLLCGLLPPILYALGDVIAGLAWQGYSFRDQTISELGAIGAPTRLVFGLFITAAWAALAALGLGTLRAAGDRRGLRVTGALLLAVGLMAVTVGHFVPMRPRGADQGLVGMLHLVEAALAMVLVFSAMAFAAASLRGGFRVYTAVTALVMLVFGAWSGTRAPAVEGGLPTPYLGVTERVFWYAYMIWFAGLAARLLREPRARGAGHETADSRSANDPSAESVVARTPMGSV